MREESDKTGDESVDVILLVGGGRGRYNYPPLHGININNTCPLLSAVITQSTSRTEHSANRGPIVSLFTFRIILTIIDYFGVVDQNGLEK